MTGDKMEPRKVRDGYWRAILTALQDPETGKMFHGILLGSTAGGLRVVWPQLIIRLADSAWWPENLAPAECFVPEGPPDVGPACVCGRRLTRVTCSQGRPRQYNCDCGRIVLVQGPHA